MESSSPQLYQRDLPSTSAKGMNGPEAYTRVQFPDRETWLAARQSAIGASDAPAVMQMSPWVSNIQLWEEKTGRRKPKDLSGIAAVQRGIDEEPKIRARFVEEHPEYLVDYHGFDILYHSGYPFISATLDGELLELATGRRGVLEIKTGSYSTQKYLDAWSTGTIPDHYFPQVCQQLLVTGWDFTVVRAQLFRTDKNYARGGNNFYLPSSYKTQYIIERTDVLDSIQAVLDADIEFWSHVMDNTMPWTSLKGGNR